MTTSMPNDQLSLLDAIAKNDAESVHFLIFGRRVCPNFVINGQSPVVTASQNGREDILNILIESHCDLTIQDFTDTTWRKCPIHIAAAKGYLGFVKKLIDNGVAVSSLDLELKTPLHWAALFGHVCVIEYLISVGASVNATQIDGFTSLHCSAALDQDNACKTLLAKGACPNTIDEDGWTPLHHASAYGHYSVVKTLQKAGASVAIKTPGGDNALHIAACTSSKNKVQLLRFLVEKKMPINEKDGCGYTALHIACFHNIYDNVKCLIELGAILNTKDYNGDSPMFSAACAYDNQDIISLLIKSGYNCSQEMWIHEERFPIALANNLPLVSMLRYRASNTRTLQELCCFCVLKHINRHSNNKINTLPIPTSLKLLLKQIIQ